MSLLCQNKLIRTTIAQVFNYVVPSTPTPVFIYIYILIMQIRIDLVGHDIGRVGLSVHVLLNYVLGDT